MALNCTVTKNDFLDGLNSLQNITNKKGTLAILSNVLIETTNGGLTLTGTDLEVGLRLFVPAEIHGEGSLTLPSKKIFEIVREFPSEEIRRRGKPANGLAAANGPFPTAIVLNLWGRVGGRLKMTNQGEVGGGLLFVEVSGPRYLHRHVRLAGAKPNLTDEHIAQRDFASALPGSN